MGEDCSEYRDRKVKEPNSFVSIVITIDRDIIYKDENEIVIIVIFTILFIIIYPSPTPPSLLYISTCSANFIMFQN